MDIKPVLKALGIAQQLESASTGTQWLTALGTGTRDIISPVDGKKITTLVFAGETEYEAVMKRAEAAFPVWRAMPAPARGEIVRQMGEAFRENKKNLGALVSYEMGKSLQEGLGEVQEMIDICDFAVGLSRQLYGLTMQSERPGHRMFEQWHPLGVAVWSWNAMLAAVCGDVCIWKPSEKTPASAAAVQHIIRKVLMANQLPEGIFSIVQGDKEIGERMAADRRIALVSATGSTRMGKRVAEVVGARLGKTLLELGGNNAIIVSEKANQDLALRAVLFGAVGTAGQRCTTTRRVIIHNSIYKNFVQKLKKAYAQVTIGSPLLETNLMGPLIDAQAVSAYSRALSLLESEGGKILYGGKVLNGSDYDSGCYVQPTLAEARNHYHIVQEETFAPILYVMSYETLEQAIAMQNDVKQGLSSAIFTESLSEAETFLSAAGSDCGIANVNIGTSGAEIGGAFGGEKETGGGRESGSDSWKNYMRRQTNTLNYSGKLPLAQGIKFDI
jgi:aldehyde dehydrogenase (NAD+)